MPDVRDALGYEDNYTICGEGPNGGASLTWLPSQGQVISQGQILYKTSDLNVRQYARLACLVGGCHRR